MQTMPRGHTSHAVALLHLILASPPQPNIDDGVCKNHRLECVEVDELIRVLDATIHAHTYILVYVSMVQKSAGLKKKHGIA